VSNGDQGSGVPPLEIPWRHGGTTRVPPATGEPSYANSTLSVFFFEPDVPEIETYYPGSHLVYLRFTLSLQPRIRLTDLFKQAGYDTEAWEFLDRRSVAPIKRAVLDVRIRTDDGDPYFVAAAPMHRQMIEDAERGIQHLDGASESLAVGKSASTLHEAFSVTTETSGGGWNVSAPVSIGGQESTTTVSGSRDAAQTVDVTNREAATERRDLLSHTTRISNILSLLNLYHVGSQQLRWRLAPTPVTGLPATAQDLYSWYTELLRQRSSGLEGVQDFYAVAVVPNTGADGKYFCVDAALTEVAVVQPVWAPEPKPIVLFDNEVELADEALDFLYRRYPVGTSIDELADVDVHETAWMGFEKADGHWAAVSLDDIRAATIEDWWYSIEPGTEPKAMRAVVSCSIRGILTTDFASKNPGNDLASGWASYKPLAAATLEARRDRVRRDFLLGMDQTAVLVNQTDLSWCRGKKLNITAAQTFVISTSKIWQGAKSAPFPGARGLRASLGDVSEALAAVAVADDALSATTALLQRNALEKFTLDHPDMQRVILGALAGLEPSDPANRDIARASNLGIDQATIKRLREQGITDLRGLAIELLRPEESRARGTGIETVRRLFDDLRPGSAPELAAAAGAVPAEDVERVRKKLAQGLRKLRPG
jgi:hypothetical protein